MTGDQILKRPWLMILEAGVSGASNRGMTFSLRHKGEVQPGGNVIEWCEQRIMQ